jgi:hypothetical protein
VVTVGCIALAAVSAVVTLRWLLVRVDAFGRVRSFPRVAAGIPALGAMLCLVPMVGHLRLEAALAKAAGILAGVQVSVRCETVDQAWIDVHPERGYVSVAEDGRPEHHAVITYDTCNDLADWLGSDKQNPSDAQVLAVHVLTHEAMHMSGILDEALAECAAVQRDTRAAGLLGASPAQARRLARHYWLVDYHQLPDTYRDLRCGADGALDEHLSDSPWAIPGPTGDAPAANAPTAQLRQAQPAGVTG